MLLHLKVKPNSKIDEIILGEDGLLKVKIKAPAIEGKANKYLISFLAEVLCVSKSKITLQKGVSSQYKIISVDANETDVFRKLSAK